jgi:hypothetical protein
MRKTNDPITFGANSMDCNNTIDFIPDLDGWTQRLKENPPDPLEDIRQEHESWLAELEGLAVKAIVIGDWTSVLEHLNEIMAWQDGKLHEAQKQKVNADEVDNPNADLNPTTQTNRKDN